MTIEVGPTWVFAMSDTMMSIRRGYILGRIQKYEYRVGFNVVLDVTEPMYQYSMYDARISTRNNEMLCMHSIISIRYEIIPYRKPIGPGHCLMPGSIKP